MAQTKTKSKKKAAPPNILNVAFIWDMSGSMAAIDDATREGTRGYIMDLKSEEAKLVEKHGDKTYTRFSLTAFDTVFEQWIIDAPIATVDVNSLIRRYQPRGGTALYDAIANTIADVASALDASDRDHEKVLVIVMTDGQENSSQEYSLRTDGKKKLTKLIKSYEERGNWSFVYLGANVDAYAEAQAIGIPVGNTAYYSASPVAVAATMDAVSNVTMTRRASVEGMSSTSFSDAGLDNDYRDDIDIPPTNVKEPKGKKRGASK